MKLREVRMIGSGSKQSGKHSLGHVNGRLKLSLAGE